MRLWLRPLRDTGYGETLGHYCESCDQLHSQPRSRFRYAHAPGNIPWLVPDAGNSASARRRHGAGVSTQRRRLLPLLCAAFLAVLIPTACASPAGKPPASAAVSPSASNPDSDTLSTATARAAPPGVICHELYSFLTYTRIYQLMVLQASGDKPLNSVELRKAAKKIADIGNWQLTYAPDEIAGDFRVVIEGIAASAAKADSKVIDDVVNPVYADEFQRSWKSVDDYVTAATGKNGERCG
jgi:hypothetical protein